MKMLILHALPVKPLLIWSLAVQLVLFGAGGHTSDNTNNCKLISESSAERKVLSQLEPLTNKTFSVAATNGEEHYTYLFQVCGDVGNIKGAGLIQVDNAGKQKAIGMYTSTQAIKGSDWVMLIYKDGEAYDVHCSKEKRKAIIMISCNKAVAKENLEVVLEDRDRQQECFYLFELDTAVMCPVLPPKLQSLSAGSILLIVGFTLLAVYLIGGFLYQRLVVGAKGVEQFPNHAFWLEVGNLAADGCDFVCRSRGNRQDRPTNRGASTEPLGEEPEERDDHLLPM